MISLNMVEIEEKYKGNKLCIILLICALMRIYDNIHDENFEGDTLYCNILVASSYGKAAEACYNRALNMIGFELYNKKVKSNNKFNLKYKMIKPVNGWQPLKHNTNMINI